MKPFQIVLLVCIAAAIAILISFLETTATYESIAEAQQSPGKFVHVAVQLDKNKPIDYDAKKDANYLSFFAKDSTGDMQVVYLKGDRPEIKIAERLVLQGRFSGNYFTCTDIQTKCPSKYKDDLKATQKNISQQVQSY